MIDLKIRTVRERMGKLREKEQLDSGSPEGASTDLTELAAELEGLFAESHAATQEIEQHLEATEERLRAVWDRSYELNKHVTTLSVASIAGVAALSRGFPASPELGSAVAVSLICFSAAIITGLFAMAGDNMEMSTVGHRGATPQGYGKILSTIELGLRWWFQLCRAASPTAFSIGLLFVVDFLMSSS
jgi:hypothetical protein